MVKGILKVLAMSLKNTRKDQILTRTLAQTPDYINLKHLIIYTSKKHNTIPADVLPLALIY